MLTPQNCMKCDNSYDLNYIMFIEMHYPAWAGVASGTQCELKIARIATKISIFCVIFGIKQLIKPLSFQIYSNE